MQIVRYSAEVVEIVVLHRVGGCSSIVMVKMWGTLVPLKGSKMNGFGDQANHQHPPGDASKFGPFALPEDPR